MNLEIIPQALSDIAEAAQYYRQQHPALADEFLSTPAECSVAGFARIRPIRTLASSATTQIISRFHLEGQLLPLACRLGDAMIRNNRTTRYDAFI